MVYIVIPVHNRKNFTRSCLCYLQKQSFRDFKTIVIDDGSADGTYDMIKNDFPEVILIKGSGNLWWTKSINIGIEKARFYYKKNDYILTLNDDIVIDCDYLFTMVDCAVQNPNSLVGSLLMDLRTKKICHSIVKNTKDLIYEKRIIVNKLVGRGMLIPVRVFDLIGLFDEKLPHYGSDEDFSIRAKKSGYNLLISPKSIIYVDEREKENMRSSIINPIEYIKWTLSLKNPFNIYNLYTFSRKNSKAWVIVFVFGLLKIPARYVRNIFRFIFIRKRTLL